MGPRRHNGYAAQFDLKSRKPVVIPGQTPNVEYSSKNARSTLPKRPIRNPAFLESDEDFDYQGYDPDAPRTKKHYIYPDEVEKYAQALNAAPSTGYDPNNQTNFLFGSSTDGSNASVASGYQSTTASERSFVAPGSRRLARSVSTMSTLTDVSALSTNYQASVVCQNKRGGPSDPHPSLPIVIEDDDNAEGPATKRRNLNGNSTEPTQTRSVAKGKEIAVTNAPPRNIRKTSSAGLVNDTNAKAERDAARGLFLVKALEAYDRGEGELLLQGYENRFAQRETESVAAFKRGLEELSSDYGRAALQRHMPEPFLGPVFSGSHHEWGDLGDIYPGSSASGPAPPVGGNGSAYTKRSKSPVAGSNANHRQDPRTPRRSASPPAPARSSSSSSLAGLSLTLRQDRKDSYTPCRRHAPAEALTLWDSDDDDDGDSTMSQRSGSDRTITNDNTDTAGDDDEVVVNKSVSDEEVSDNDGESDYDSDEDLEHESDVDVYEPQRSSTPGIHRSSPIPTLPIRRTQSEGGSLVGRSRSRRVL